MVLEFLYIIQLIAIAICFLLIALFVTLSIRRRKNRLQLVIFISTAIAFITVTVFIWQIDLFNGETKKKENATAAFESNFGFTPPDTIKEIKIKNFTLYDAAAHWMSFTYDSIIFNRILIHDQPLDTVSRNTPAYDSIIEELKKGRVNHPDWLELPNTNTPKIYTKKNFWAHTSSAYYLWVDFQKKMVYLEVSYFD